MNIWVKTLLTSYRYLERMANAIDKIVMTRATGAFFVSGQNLSFNSVENVSEDILNLTEKKVCLINLKLILDEAFKKVNPKYASLLITVFIEGRNCYQSSELLEISLRTLFRRQNEALESFSKVLTSLGHDEKFFEEMLSGQSWIMEIRERYLGNDKHFETGKINFLKKIKDESKYKKDTIKKAIPQIQNSLSF